MRLPNGERVPIKKIAWMSFDLGVQGDYEGLYRWLDAQGARECGDNLALFSFASKKDLPAEVKARRREIGRNRCEEPHISHLHGQGPQDEGTIPFWTTQAGPLGGIRTRQRANRRR
jgi:hypothetical protein